jgi:DNA-directed RNA polymerase subunit RPC12/RpoP
MKKPKIKTYQIQAIYAGCTKCGGELVNEYGSFMLLPHETKKIRCQDCETEHDFPKNVEKIRGPKHPAFIY